MITEKQKANLKPIRSENEARKKGKIGGILSGRKRRQKKTFKEIIEYCLNLDTPKDIKEKLKATFPQINEKDLNLQFAMVLSMINMTFKNNNNVVSLFQALRDTIGEKPVEKQNILLNNPPQIIIKNDVPRPNKQIIRIIRF